jgi:hypothetical protein
LAFYHEVLNSQLFLYLSIYSTTTGGIILINPITITRKEKNKMTSKIQETVETLSEEELKRLARVGLSCIVEELEEKIVAIATCTRIHDARLVKKGIETYKEFEEAVKKYGLWDEAYTKAFEKAIKTGDVGRGYFNKIHSSRRQNGTTG